MGSPTTEDYRGRSFVKLFLPFIGIFIVCGAIQLGLGVATRQPVYSGLFAGFASMSIYSVYLIWFQIKIGYAFDSLWRAKFHKEEDRALFLSMILFQAAVCVWFMYSAINFGIEAGYFKL